MQDVGYTVFMGFGGLWVLMGIAAVIFLFKSDGQKLRFGKWGLLVAIPILVPIVLVLTYQIARPFISHTFERCWESIVRGRKELVKLSLVLLLIFGRSQLLVRPLTQRPNYGIVILSFCHLQELIEHCYRKDGKCRTAIAGNIFPILQLINLYSLSPIPPNFRDF
jgi:hypothetical protein